MFSRYKYRNIKTGELRLSNEKLPNNIWELIDRKGETRNCNISSNKILTK